MGRRRICHCSFGNILPWRTGILFQGAFPGQAPIHSNIGASCTTTSGRCWKAISSAKSCCCLFSTFCRLCLPRCTFTFLSLCLHLLTASALLHSVCEHISRPPSLLLPSPTSPFVLYHWQSRSHAGSQQGGNMKGTMTFSEAVFEKRRPS